MGLLGREDVRLLTLTGPGGSGKTRLAAQAAGEASSAYPDGVWWVELAPLRDPALVLPAATQVLDAQGALAEHIRDRRLLIVFDNFEQVVRAADDVGELLAVCPRLDVLVTSREPLHLGAEHQYAVPPFREVDAVDFFVARARATRQDFEANGEVPLICRRLESLPLALELAAARVKALSARQILERLEHRLPLLTGGVRNVPERQRTLEATIAWSYELLDQDEQRLFRRLSVFVGGSTLAAAERVAEADIDTLQSLVDKSLLRYSDERYWMLESIREYAAGRLDESGEADELRERHARHYLDVAEAAGLTLEPRGEQQYELVARRGRQPACRARLVARERAGALPAARRGARRLLGGHQPGRGHAVVRAPAGARRGRAARASRADVHGLRKRREPGRRRCARRGDVPAEPGRVHGARRSERRLGRARSPRGERALPRRRRARPGAEPSRPSSSAGRSAIESSRRRRSPSSARSASARDEHELGLELLEQGADLAGEIDFPWWRSRTLRKLADCMLDLGRAADAEAYSRESLRLMRPIGDRQMMVFALARLARIAAETGRPEEAGLIWGAIEAEEARSTMGAWAKERERFWKPIRPYEGPEFERGRELGRGLSFAEGVDAALGASQVGPPTL